MSNLQSERDLMVCAENAVRTATSNGSPAVAAVEIVKAYESLTSASERVAFVSVLASRVAVNAYRASAEKRGLFA